MKYAIVLMVFFAFSCKSQKQQMETDDRLTLLVQDGYFPTESPETQVIKDEKSLRAFFSKVNRTRKPGLPIPEVDFTTHSVLVACMGAMNTDSLPILYLKSETPDEMVISAEIPIENKGSDVQSYPFCVYSIADEGKKITLEME